MGLCMSVQFVTVVCTDLVVIFRAERFDCELISKLDTGIDSVDNIAYLCKT